MFGIIKSFIDWMKLSNRYKHLGLGIIFGTIADDWYCLEYGAVGVAGAMEFKDGQWGGKPDIVDAILTIIGFNIGYLIRLLCLKII